jgi:hypothetical protein
LLTWFFWVRQLAKSGVRWTALWQLDITTAEMEAWGMPQLERIDRDAILLHALFALVAVLALALPLGGVFLLLDNRTPVIGVI